MRFCLLLLGLCGLCSIGTAGRLEKDLNAAWRGSHVVVTTDAWTNCDGFHTNNKIFEERVDARASHRFDPGELARVSKIRVKRKRIDVLFQLDQGLLVPYREGPFELFREVNCLVEFRFPVARELVKAGDVSAINRKLERIFKRFGSRDQARASEAWNRRIRDPYPRDYEETLREHAIWKADQQNAAVQARIDESIDAIAEITRRVRTDADYGAGLAEGMKSMRHKVGRSCDQLLDRRFDQDRRSPSSSASNAWKDGFDDGQELAWHAAVADLLRDCFVSAP